MCPPSGVQTGNRASANEGCSCRGTPPVAGTIHVRAEGMRFAASPIQYAIHLPSGEKRGLLPRGATRRSCPPKLGITYTPPPCRSDRNAIEPPSGEKDGCVSSAGLLVSRTVSPPLI